MKLYIAGPMTGYEQYNFPAFFDAETTLEIFGHFPVNPARNDVEIDEWDARVSTDPPPLTGSQYMARDIPLLLDCDGIVLLAGWRDSTGACIEAFVAAMMGLSFHNQRGELMHITKGAFVVTILARMIDHLKMNWGE